MRQWYRGTMDSTTNQKQPEISFSPHTPLGFPRKRKRSHTGCAQEFGEFSTLSVTCSIHSREESGGTVLKPCTYHRTLSRAPKERPPSALSVRFLTTGGTRLASGGPEPKDLQAPRTWSEGLHCPQRASTLVSCTHALCPTRKTATHLAREGHDHHLERWPHCKTQPEERPGFSGGVLCSGSPGPNYGAPNISVDMEWPMCTRQRSGEARGILSRAWPPREPNLIAGENPKAPQRGAAKLRPYWASA